MKVAMMINTKQIGFFIQKVLYACAPVYYGIFLWFMNWGYGASLFPHGLIRCIFLLFLYVSVVYCFFSACLYAAQKRYALQLFEYHTPVPPWWFFLLLLVVARSFICLPLVHAEWMESLCNGVIFSGVFEEFISRTFFIKYRMSLREFLFFNALSSLAFMYMHEFYTQHGIGLYQLWMNGHFTISFIWGLIIYQCRRIELTILLHMLNNLLRYTIPVCIFHCTWPSIIQAMGHICVDVAIATCLAGATYYCCEQ